MSAWTLDTNAAMIEDSAEKILFALKTRGPQTAADLAGRLGVTAEGARQHLAKLASRGLVDHSDERRGVGRPKRHWALTGAGHARFPDTHSDLTVDLIGAVRSLFGDDGLDRLIARREERQLDGYGDALAGARGLRDRVARLAELRTREGYMAAWTEEADGSFLLVENHCPICAAATVCQGFCRSELDIFRTVLGPDARVERSEHLLAGARRCAYRIEPVGRNGEAVR